ncbi:flavodoxin domain-containing protein [Corynebacterium sp. L4756]|uniref:flavodoxin domain-containing protein n=1 Tax=unclassified Corynebacterium TaxID=2624378 RepID=UPI00374CA568
MVLVLYKSDYGSSKEYADAFAARCETTAATWTDSGSVRALLADASGADSLSPVVVFSYIHGPKVPGVDAAIAAWKQGRPTALCIVGMTLLDKARSDDALANQTGEDITRFYLPGRMNYSELSTAHTAVMSGIVNAIRMKPKSLRSANDQSMIDMFKKDLDRVDLSELDPVYAWAESKESSRGL